MKRTALCFFLNLVILAAASHAGEPDPLAPYRDFVAQAQKSGHTTLDGVQWETVFEGKPDPAKPFWGKATNVLEKAAVREVEVKTEKVGDATVLTFDAEQCEAAFLPLGEKVKGDVALEIVCRSLGNRLNDLSILLDGLAAGPGFQFGGYNNGRNILRSDDVEGNWRRLTDLPTERVIVRERWHTVRLEIVRGVLRASVDGEALGTVECGEAYKPGVERQPLFYVYDSRAQLKRYTVQKPKTPTAPTAAEKAREAEVETKVAGLIKLLDHEEFKVRNEAQRLLSELGHRAFKQLRVAVANGTLEQRLRAREILGLPEE